VLNAGIDVITTLNIQHLESLNDLVESITGVRVRETLPDRILDQADEVELIDISPYALRQRMRHGNIYLRTASSPHSTTSFVREISPLCANWPCGGQLRRPIPNCTST